MSQHSSVVIVLLLFAVGTSDIRQENDARVNAGARGRSQESLS